MAKDPAFLLYYQDFLVGTAMMADDDIGKYMKILCHMADKGGYLTKNDMLNICKCENLSDVLWNKFKSDEEDVYYNERLLSELQKRRKYSESRRKNRSGESYVIDMMKICFPKFNTYDRHMEDEDENVNKIEKLLLREDFQKAWEEWETYRRESRKPLTKSSIKKQLFMLIKQPDPIAVINRSIEKQWQGLFEIKPERNNGNRLPIVNAVSPKSLPKETHLPYFCNECKKNVPANHVCSTIGKE